MAVITKTLAEVVTAWENGEIEVCLWASKKPGADRVVAFIRDANGVREVWDIG